MCVHVCEYSLCADKARNAVAVAAASKVSLHAVQFFCLVYCVFSFLCARLLQSPLSQEPSQQPDMRRRGSNSRFKRIKGKVSPLSLSLSLSLPVCLCVSKRPYLNALHAHCDLRGGAGGLFPPFVAGSVTGCSRKKAEYTFSLSKIGASKCPCFCHKICTYARKQ